MERGPENLHLTESARGSKELSQVSSWFAKKTNQHSTSTSKASADRHKEQSMGSRRNSNFMRLQENEIPYSQRSRSQRLAAQAPTEHNRRKDLASGRFFTTNNEISSVVFKQHGRIKSFIRPEMREILLSNQVDVETFVVGAAR